ncbi:MAG: hypothetical protein CVT92_10825 [Bacteroidetes bacterium HGW-Bacteroidetes-1]|jgi:hypothetical protein|nr:MAG: hypothetical protein CVT92_10825 [Bacteroidetes bacterium HGW-Bacteroidetes-1]
MSYRIQFLLWVLLLIFFSLSLKSQGVKGIISDSKGNPVPYSSVYVPSLQSGTTANDDGIYQLLLESGAYELIIQYLGYKTQTIPLTIGENISTLNVILEPQNYNLPEVIVTSSGEDPAYYIMRKAIGMSQYYRNQVSEYQAKIYLRGTGVALKIPALMRRQLKKEGIEQGEYFVMENISEIHFKKGEPVQTNVISMRSSGNMGETSPMQFVTLSLYDDIDGIITPLSRNAFQVYKFKLEGSFIENEHTINKIRVIPKRKGQDLYSGTIFIREGSWNIHSVDLKVIQKMVSIQLRQVYHPVDQLVWMPVSHDYNILFDAMGGSLSYRYLVTVNDYKLKLNSGINHDFYARLIADEREIYDNSIEENNTVMVQNLPENDRKKRVETLIERDDLTNKEMRELNKLIKMEVTASQPKAPLEVKVRNIEVADSAQLRKPDYWQHNRPVPLTTEELKSFDELPKDSTTADTTVSKKHTLLREIITGVDKKKLSENWTLKHNGIAGLSSFSFNTVDGFLYSKKLKATSSDSLHRKLSFEAAVDYAFARERFGATLDIAYTYNPLKRSSIRLKGGRSTSDFNAEKGIMPFFNTFTTLFTKQNYLKLYEKDYAGMTFQSDIVNGLTFTGSLEYQRRTQVENNSDFFLTNLLGREFTSNIPQRIVLQPELVKDHKPFIIEGSISYTPRYFYRIVNHSKQMLYSSYPTLGLAWRQGLKGVGDSDNHFQQFEISIKQGFEARLWGRFDYFLKAGVFPDNTDIHFADFKHFNNSSLWISGGEKLSMFRGLNFYERSTNASYFESHFQYQHSRILLKRIPLLSGSLIRESLFLNTLASQDDQLYVEIGYGLNQLFLVFDLEVFTGFLGGKHHQTGFRIGIPINEGTVRF